MTDNDHTRAAPLHSLPLRADWEQALLHGHWPGGPPYRYRKKSEEYAAQYDDLVAEARAAVAAGADPVVEHRVEAATDGFRWACVHCGSNGPADGAGHAAALAETHRGWACPATAVVYDDTPPIRRNAAGEVLLNGAQGGNGYVQRVARHENLHRLYPDLVPAWTGSFRGRDTPR